MTVECEATSADGLTLAGLVAMVGEEQGVAPVADVLRALAAAVERVHDGQREVTATVVAELTRRYLRAVRCHSAGAPVAGSWQVLLRWWEPGSASEVRAVLAGVAVLAGGDLGPSVVSTCTLLGHAPGPAEQDVVDTLSLVLAGIVRAAGQSVGQDDPDGAAAARRLLRVLARRRAWTVTQRLWTLRGHPAQAAAERAALDRRTGAAVLALLG